MKAVVAALLLDQATAFVAPSSGANTAARSGQQLQSQQTPSNSRQAASSPGASSASISVSTAFVGLLAGAGALSAVNSFKAAGSAERRAAACVPVRAFETETGVQPPVGYWDPLGLASDGSVGTFKRRREVELKHGRVSMFACIGYITPEYYKLSGYLSPSYGVKFADVPNGLGALGKVPAPGWLQIVTFAGLVELNVYAESREVNGEPGNYGSGFLALRTVGIMNTGITDPEQRKKKLNIELANGRLAMMAIIGMFFQDGCTGSAWGDWALYTESPLRAFESELGVQAPVGFWDPAGLAADGSASNFARRRETEIKHGRVSMIACIGYIVPEYFKWPGYLSPSNGIRFEDVPNGLAAIAKVPAFGWTQAVLFAFYLEFNYFQYDPARGPGDYANGGVLGLPNGSTMGDAEARKKRLGAEIANGRLAMVAIIGMFFQDGLTGQAWGSWSLYTDSPLR